MLFCTFYQGQEQSPEIKKFMTLAAEKIKQNLDKQNLDDFTLKNFLPILRCFSLLNLKGDEVQQLAQKMTKVVRKNANSFTPAELATFAEILAEVTTNTIGKTPAMLFTEPTSHFTQTSAKTATEIRSFMKELASQSKKMLSLSPKQLLSLAFTFVKLGIEGAEVRSFFNAIAPKIQENLSTFSRQELSDIAYTFTHMNCFGPQFVKSWEEAVQAKSKNKPLPQEIKDFQALYKRFCQTRSAEPLPLSHNKSEPQANIRRKTK